MYVIILFYIINVCNVCHLIKVALALIDQLDHWHFKYLHKVAE
jgi:hypothetical protein